MCSTLLEKKVEMTLGLLWKSNYIKSLELYILGKLGILKRLYKML